jgi:hypothetical protein
MFENNVNTTGQPLSRQTRKVPKFQLFKAACQIYTCPTQVTPITPRRKKVMLNELRIQTAKIGANGVILISTENSSSGGVIMGRVCVANEIIRSRDQAIYAIQE